MANGKRKPWFLFIEKVLFRLAFAGFILTEVVLWCLLLAGVSRLIPADNFFLGGILAALVFIGLFPIGAGSYLLFQRLTRAAYVLAESEKWLAERKSTTSVTINWRRSGRWMIWIPTLSVLVFCFFLDRTLPPLSRLFHPAYGRLGAYRVSMPLDWTVVFSESAPGGNRGRSYVYANHWKGLLRSGIDEFIGRKSSLTGSSLTCASARSAELDAFSSTTNQEGVVATRRYLLGNVILTCEESVYRNPQTASRSRTISCVTSERDFYCTLYGGDEGERSEVYNMVQRIRKTE